MCEGKITISVTDDERGMGLHVSADMSGVGIVERVLLLNAFCEAMDIDEALIFTYLVTKDRIKDSTSKVEVDAAAIRELLGEDEK